MYKTLCLILLVVPLVAPACDCQSRKQTIVCQGLIDHDTVTELGCYTTTKTIFLYSDASIQDCEAWRNESRIISVASKSLCTCLPMATECHSTRPTSVTTSGAATTRPTVTTTTGTSTDFPNGTVPNGTWPDHAALTTGAQAGIGIGTVLAFVLSTLVLYFMVRKCRHPAAPGPAYIPMAVYNPVYNPPGAYYNPVAEDAVQLLNVRARNGDDNGARNGAGADNGAQAPQPQKPQPQPQPQPQQKNENRWRRGGNLRATKPKR